MHTVCSKPAAISNSAFDAICFRKPPKMTLRQITKDNFPSLLRSIDSSIDLLGRLRSVPFVDDRISSIEEQDTDDLKNNALLKILLEVPEDLQESVMNGFISALRSSGQDHVANIFHRVKFNEKVIMSEEHYELLVSKQYDLCQFMNPKGVLINSPSSFKIFSRADKRKILSKAALNDMADEMVEVLLRKSDDAFPQFITTLRETGQSHVAYILTGEGDSRPLKEEHRTRLLTHREFLVNTIDSEHGLMTYLMRKGVFCSYDEQCVDGVQPHTPYKRNQMIVDLIARKSQSDFFNFISALKYTGQKHVAVALIGADVVAKIKTVYESGADVDHVRDVDEELLQYMREMFQRDGEVVSKINRTLTRNGVAVSDVREGCIEVTFTCKSVESLHSFRDLSDAGELEKMINEAFCSQFAEKGLKSLKVVISNDQFEQCAQMFARWIPMTLEHREALLSSENLLANKIKVNDALLDKLSLCKRRREAIESAGAHEEQVKTLIDIVSRQPDSGFAQLLNALNDTKQTEAADIISGGSSSAIKIKASELQKTHKTDAWEEVDRSLDILLRSIRVPHAREVFKHTAHNIYPALHGVVAALHKLREQNTVPSSDHTTEEDISGELERLLLRTERHSTRAARRSGKSFLADRICYTV